MFLVGFIAMAAQSGALAFMESIDILKLEETCQSDPEELKDLYENESLGWLYVPLARMANSFDDYSESMLDGIMCTATCPCYGDSTADISKQKENNDTFTAYANLDRE